MSQSGRRHLRSSNETSRSATRATSLGHIVPGASRDRWWLRPRIQPARKLKLRASISGHQTTCGNKSSMVGVLLADVFSLPNLSRVCHRLGAAKSFNAELVSLNRSRTVAADACPAQPGVHDTDGPQRAICANVVSRRGTHAPSMYLQPSCIVDKPLSERYRPCCLYKKRQGDFPKTWPDACKPRSHK